MLKVMSQNVMCWGSDGQSIQNRRPLMKKAISESGADVIGFQEVIPEWKSAFDADIPEYESYLVYRSEKNAEGTPIYWNPEKVDMIESGHFWLSETPDVSSVGWDAVCVRITCWARFVERATGKPFVFVNTHLDHKGAMARINGIRQICSFIKEKFGDIPLILTGDFNATPDSETLDAARMLLSDARTAAKSSSGEITFHNFGKDSETIDYIFLSKNIRCESFDIVKVEKNGVTQSDHNGITATVSL